MNFGKMVLSQSKLAITVTLILAVVGALGLAAMPKQEDPRLQDRFGLIVVAYPGADAESIERLIVRPLEDRLSNVTDIKSVVATARPEVAIIDIDLLDRTRDIENTWDEVQDAINEAKRDFPVGVLEPTLNRKLLDLETVVFAITGSEDPLVLRAAAQKAKDRLIRVREVARVEIVGDPGEQVSVRIDEDKVQSFGLDRRAVVDAIAKANTNEPSGSLKVSRFRAGLDAGSSFGSLAQIRDLPLQLGSDRQISLSQIATVVVEPRLPQTKEMNWNGRLSVGLGVIPARDIDVIALGKRVRIEAKLIAAEIAPLQLDVVAFQPDRSAKRLSELANALLQGIVSVAVVLILWMGLRMGLIVSLSVPLISVLGLTAYFMGGGVLHQISIAAFIIAVGQFIDNVIVITESAQRRMDEGAAAREAAEATIDEFKLPMVFATGTAIAAFLPMLASQGGTADFTFAIPLIAVITLIVSYFYSIVVAPALCAFALKRSRSSGSKRVENLGSALGRIASRYPWVVVVAGVTAMVISLALFPKVKKQFFPEADRNEFVAVLELPAGTDFSVTRKAAMRLGDFLRERNDVSRFAYFVGGGMPQFYYNLPRVPSAPNVAQFLIVTKNTGVNKALAAEVRRFTNEHLADARVITRLLEQGPPIDSPIEVRLQGQDLTLLQGAAYEIEGALREIPGALEPRNDLGIGALRIRIENQDANASRYGLTRRDLTLALLKESSGLPLGQYRVGREPIPIVIRSGKRTQAGDGQTGLADLGNVQISALPQSSLRVRDLSSSSVFWTPAQITRRNGLRQVAISSDLQPGAGYNEVMNALRQRIEKVNIPKGVTLSFGGQEEGAEEANTAIFKAVPFALIVLLICLLLEFRSFRKIGVVLLSIPLILVGVVPGLLLGQAAFGFMSLLGILALVGIVVNNSILLFEAIEIYRGEGRSIDDALVTAIRLRVRPILLTTVATIVGLIPLAFEDSTLWPPLAWTMISGIVASAAMSMLFIPALYKIVFAKSNLRASLSIVVGLLAAMPGEVHALEKAELTLREVMEQAVSLGENVKVQSLKAQEAEARVTSAKRNSFAPKLDVQFAYTQRDRDWTSRSPFGSSVVGERGYASGALQVTQPLFDAESMLSLVPAAEAKRAAESKLLEWARRQAKVSVGRLFFEVQLLDVELELLTELQQTLRRQELEMDRLYALGRVFEADQNQVRLARSKAEHQFMNLERVKESLLLELAMLIGTGQPVKLKKSRPEEIVIGQAWRQQSADSAWTSRPDAQAFEDLIAAQMALSRSASRRALPSLALQGRAVHTGQRQVEQTDWLEAQVVLRWSLFDSGARGSEAAAESFVAQGIARRREGARLRSGVELHAAKNDLAVLDDRIQRSERDVRLAQVARDRQAERYRAGKLAYSEILEADQALLEQKRIARRLPFERAKAYLHLQLVSGKEPGLDAEVTTR